jgi:hypothetical protein
MLDVLRTSGKATARKLRLFACACVRRAWHILTDERCRRAVEVAERFADGLAGAEELATAAAAAIEEPTHSAVADAACESAHSLPERAARGAAFTTSVALAAAAPDVTKDSERALQATLIRDLFGPLPFRNVVLDPVWLTETVRSLAEAAYQERQVPGGTLDPARLGILADALEDAGAEGELVAHLREQGSSHVRGCWALDALLGREGVIA